jgi:hypothetical protein
MTARNPGWLQNFLVHAGTADKRQIFNFCYVTKPPSPLSNKEGMDTLWNFAARC